MQSQNRKNGNKEETKLEYSQSRLFIYDAKDAVSAISLLTSNDKTLLIAIEALLIYACKSKDNLQILYDLDIMTPIFSLLEHKDLFIRRFAAKLLIDMMAVPNVENDFYRHNYLLYLVKLVTNETDNFMREYFFAILAKLSKNPYTASVISNCDNINFIFDGIYSTDPDIMKNCLEFTYHIMQDPKVWSKIKFDLPFLYQHFESPYPEIQCFVLNVVVCIIEKNKDENIQSLFHKTNGVEASLNFLKNNEWNNLHIKALRILRFAAENPIIVDKLIEIGSIPQILSYINYVTTPKLFVEAFRVIVNIANTSNGRKVLHAYKIIQHLIDALQQWTHPDIAEVVCYGIGKMTLFDLAAKEFASKELVNIILDLLKKEDLQWSTKCVAGFALKKLLMTDIRNCEIFLDIHGHDYLLQLIKQFVEQVPIETSIVFLEALFAIACYPKLRDTLINLDTFDTLCLLLESVYPFLDELKISCCNLLSMLCLEKSGRDYFIKVNGPQRLYSFITEMHSISLRNSVIQLVQTISTDLTISNVFVENKYLSYMLNNRSSSRVIPSWDTCIKTLFKSHLPMKFALTGRLSLQDLTQDGFYVLRRNICPFPILSDVFQFKYCPLEPIYVVNCVPSSTLSNTLQTTFKENINVLLESKFGQLQCDLDFTEYVELFKRMVLATESKIDANSSDTDRSTNIRYVPLRARMLGRFVARQMSGFDPTNKCIDHQLEAHLREIKERLETSVIPLGQLRVGSYLERALLFKAIADRICLPAALVRGEYGISWIEIAVPQTDNSNEEQPSSDYSDEKDREKMVTPASSKLLDKSDISIRHNKRNMEKILSPTKLIESNFIVDLMNVPGDLIPIGSLRSKLYCTKKMTRNKICCD